MVTAKDAKTCAGIVLASVLAGGLSGCPLQGPAGSTGSPGPPGPGGSTVIVSGTPPTTLNIVITGVDTDAHPVVHFSATDQAGLSFPGLQATNLRFTVAELLPGENGDTDHWQNYLNALITPAIGPGTQPTVQPQTENNGVFINNGDGTYAYTFSTDISNVTQPVAVTYNPQFTHRVGMEVRGSYQGVPLPATNAVYTFQPATGLTRGIADRIMVTTASCDSCHGKLALHGGGRVDTGYCVMCHNPGNTDPNSGNSLDFRVMVHKIHMGENLPSVQAGNPYFIVGYRNSINDFSDVVFPQDIRNCSKCHDANNPKTPTAVNWYTHPSIQACGACHDDVDFAKGSSGGHEGGVVTGNSECTICHSDNRIAGSVPDVHAIAGKLAAAAYQFNILGVADTAPGQFPKVRFSVTDPTHNNAPYTLTEPVWDTAKGARLAVDLAWPTRDYTNTGLGGGAPAQALSFSALSAVNNGDGSFTATSLKPIPVTASGSGAIGLEGHPVTASGSVPVKSEVSYFAITDPTVFPRREVVDTAKCQNCHGQNDGLSLHGKNRTDNVRLCVMCHNPEDTDLVMRPADPDGQVNGVNSAAADSLEERPIDFKTMIHAIHGAGMRTDPLVVYGFHNSVNNFADVRFPGILQNCTGCHLPGTYEPPLPASARGTTVVTGATVLTASPFGSSSFATLWPGAPSNPDLNQRITPTAATCAACHDSTLAKAHMQQNGASFSVVQSFISSSMVVETCALCHGSGQIADVKVMHGVKD